MTRLRALLHPDVIGATVVVVGALLVTGLGLAEVPSGWIIAGTLGLAVAAALAGHAARPEVDDDAKVKLLAGTIFVLVLLILGAAGYSRWWDSSRAGPRSWDLVLRNASEADCVSVSGEPGGEPLLLAPRANAELAPVCGSLAYPFECQSEDGRGTPWLRLAGSGYWLPAQLLRPAVGSREGDLPAC